MSDELYNVLNIYSNQMHMHEKYTRVYLVSISIENVSFWVCIHCSTRTNQ